MVWTQANAWRWESECGRFRIERFIIGEHAGLDDFPWPDRWRIIKRLQEWEYECSPSEGSLASAKDACEGLVNAR